MNFMSEEERLEVLRGRMRDSNKRYNRRYFLEFGIQKVELIILSDGV